ncbi:MAG TPA: hypothetical protein VJY62_16160 [Bacteroidia bacterium]|nr:hypothetical protein [Bacteroidia bacterium]
MHRYKNLSLNSGVTHYSIGNDFIEVKFKNKPAIYIYSYSINGKEHIEKMKKLAAKGQGLSTYISQHPEVKNHFINQ